MNENQTVVHLHLDDIIPNRFQPREVFDEKALKELAVSIKEHGVIQPIIVRKINDTKYEIIAGERRYKASALAGLTSIPAIIKNLDDKESAKVALLENLQRRNLNPIEEARTYQKIVELDQMTQEELAKTMGKSQSAVANKIRLLSLTEEVQKSLLKEEISERHARTLLNIHDPEKQIEMLEKVIKEKMTVKQLENTIKEMNTPPTENIQDKQELSSTLDPNQVLLNNETNDEETSSEGNNSSLNTNNTPLPAFSKNNNSNTDDNIINYGEVNDEEETEEHYPELDGNNSSLLSNPINLMDLKNKTKDITNINDAINQINNPQKMNTSPDTLLNTKPNLMSSSNDTSNKLTPAEQALRDSENKNYENKEDYFSAPNLMSIELPNTSTYSKNNSNDMFSNPTSNNNSLIEFTKNTNKTKPSNNETNKQESLTNIKPVLFQQKSTEVETNSNQNKKSLGSVLMNEALKNHEKTQEEYNIQQMVNEIRKTLKELEMHGAKIDTDEMNFENQYQILIKIDKDSNY